MAKFTTLYSGSSGNCAFLEEDGRFLLVDMGKSCRATTVALSALGVDMRRLGGILVTHEHSDHVSGLAVFLKRYPVPVYGTAATLEQLHTRKLVPPGTLLETMDGSLTNIAGFGVRSFATSHDSVDCCGYHITTPQGKRLAIATDLGYVSDEVMNCLLNADVVALEANYDKEMLKRGPYPPYLKGRIASKRGHLCNEETAATLAKVMAAGCERAMLCHISKENNTPACALQTVTAGLAAAGITPGAQATVRAAQRDVVSEPFVF
jgi:phosphoribosyl 1,2-cyclic phosphodiesterase